MSLRVVTIPPAGQVAALTEAGLPPAFAQAVAELHAAFAAGIAAPSGDRSLTGKTTLEETLKRVLEAAPSAAP